MGLYEGMRITEFKKQKLHNFLYLIALRESNTPYMRKHVKNKLINWQAPEK